ncbi:MAG: hypothetical protein RLZZ540_1789 [Bacteroidota bacterium]|jgi:beta-galactosidase
MNKFLSFTVTLFSMTFLFSQEVEIKKWNFSSEKNPKIQPIKIPHTWNAIDAFDDEPGYWRGKGTYTTTVNITTIKKVHYIHFNGVNQQTKVWINGSYAGQHKGGYTAFDIDISSYVKQGTNKITVGVDNTNNETIPPLEADFTFYGGIYRSVYLCEEETTHFKKSNGADAIKIDALLDNDWQGELQLKGAISNKNKQLLNPKVRLNIKDATNKLIATIEENIGAEFNLNVKLKNPLLWSPQTPNLYNVELNLLDVNGKILDIYHQKIGFRKFEATTSGFNLNGKPIKLIGVNRHQDFEGIGNAVPIQKQIQELVMIKNMGSNFLRLAHYPQDKAVYKAADSLGLILWSEIPVVNNVPINANYSEYKGNCIQMQKEHIDQNYNHPSLIFVGYMNEIFLRMYFDRPENEIKQKIIKNTLDLAQTLEDLTRKEAPNHITVMAIHGNQIYNETKIASLPMVLGWNLYQGWYSGQIQDLGVFLDEENKKYPNRPLIISEYGVDADKRLHNSDPKKMDFSEEYQFKYHPGYYQQLKDRPYVIGMTAWNFADFGSELRGNPIPHVNQKGLVNFDRSPKNIYYWYKAILKPEEKLSQFFKDLPTHISDSPKKKIIIISNQKVFLKVNDSEKIELQENTGLIETWINLKEGSNNLSLYDEFGKLQDSTNLIYQKPDLSKSNTLAINFGTENYFIDDKNQIWIPYNQQSLLKVLGTVQNVNSSSNIKNTTNDPIYQSSISNVEKITAELPKGDYEVTLLFSLLKKDKSLVYELNNKKEDANTVLSNQNIKINGKLIKIEKINPFDKTDCTTTIKVEKDLIIEIVNETEKITISGIKIKKLF